MNPGESKTSPASLIPVRKHLNPSLTGKKPGSRWLYILTLSTSRLSFKASPPDSGHGSTKLRMDGPENPRSHSHQAYICTYHISPPSPSLTPGFAFTFSSDRSSHNLGLLACNHPQSTFHLAKQPECGTCHRERRKAKP